MPFELRQALEILESTPKTLKNMLVGLDPVWTSRNEGGETWCVYDVVGHLIHGEKTDWMTRAELILSDQAEKSFAPFDRFAQFEESKGKTMLQLLDEFEALRYANLQCLQAKNLMAQDLARTGIHPAFGTVTLGQLLATWTVHDLNHLAQIARIMAHQYQAEVGPWVAYLRILQG